MRSPEAYPNRNEQERQSGAENPLPKTEYHFLEREYLDIDFGPNDIDRIRLQLGSAQYEILDMSHQKNREEIINRQYAVNEAKGRGFQEIEGSPVNTRWLMVPRDFSHEGVPDEFDLWSKGCNYKGIRPGEEIVIGSDPGNKLANRFTSMRNNESISGRHCTLLPDKDGRWFNIDDSSSQGTRVEIIRMAKPEIKPDDGRFSLAKYAIELSDDKHERPSQRGAEQMVPPRLETFSLRGKKPAEQDPTPAEKYQQVLNKLGEKDAEYIEEDGAVILNMNKVREAQIKFGNTELWLLDMTRKENRNLITNYQYKLRQERDIADKEQIGFGKDVIVFDYNSVDLDQGLGYKGISRNGLPLVFGRESDAGLLGRFDSLKDDESISENHFDVSLVNGRGANYLIIRDLGSESGTEITAFVDEKNNDEYEQRSVPWWG
ncbi:MAG: FHA domain-containing protein [Candidatus Nanosyncoccaceae bacterium]|jgi:hypothetical protein